MCAHGDMESASLMPPAFNLHQFYKFIKRARLLFLPIEIIHWWQSPDLKLRLSASMASKITLQNHV
jgi:hypothetical protein